MDRNNFKFKGNKIKFSGKVANLKSGNFQIWSIWLFFFIWYFICKRLSKTALLKRLLAKYKITKKSQINLDWQDLKIRLDTFTRNAKVLYIMSKFEMYYIIFINKFYLKILCLRIFGRFFPKSEIVVFRGGDRNFSFWFDLGFD